MSALRLFLAILCIFLGNVSPFALLLTSTSNTSSVVENTNGNVNDAVVAPPTDLVSPHYNIHGYSQYDLEGYCVIEIPSSHFEIQSSELNTQTQKYFKYKDSKTRLLMGYVTNIKSDTDVPGYIVREVAGVDMVTNSKQTVTYGNEDWMMVPSTSPINGNNIVVWYKLAPNGKSAFWMKATKDTEIDEDEFTEVITGIINTYQMYYLGDYVFKEPTTGIYGDGKSDNNETTPDGYRKNDEGNNVFIGRGGFVECTELSNSWKDMEFIVDGQKISLPCTYMDLIDAGFKIHDSKITIDKEIAAQRQQNVLMSNDRGTVINVQFDNQTTGIIKITGCTVTGVEIDPSKFIAASEIDTSIESETEESIQNNDVPSNDENENEELSEPEEGVGDTNEEDVLSPEPSSEEKTLSEEESSEETSTSDNTSSVTHELILPGGITWDVYTDDLKEFYGACTSATLGNKDVQLTFKNGNNMLIINIGTLKGIKSVYFTTIGK